MERSQRRRFAVSESRHVAVGDVNIAARTIQSLARAEVCLKTEKGPAEAGASREGGTTLSRLVGDLVFAGGREFIVFIKIAGCTITSIILLPLDRLRQLRGLRHSLTRFCGNRQAKSKVERFEVGRAVRARL
jgi:hypothetical protein